MSDNSICPDADCEGYLTCTCRKPRPNFSFDLERMKAALASPPTTIPNGLSKEEMLAFIINNGR